MSLQTTGRSTLVLAIAVLVCPAVARSELSLRMSPTHIRMAPATATTIPVVISSDPETGINSVDLSFGLDLAAGDVSSSVTIHALDLTAPDNVWQSGPTVIPFPALPVATTAVLSVFQLDPAVANGNVFNVTLSSQNTIIGDVFDVSLNHGGHSAVGGGFDDLTSQTDFVGGRVLIVADPTLVADFNGDGKVDIDDIDLFMVGLHEGTPDEYYDLDASGMLDILDRDYLIENVFNTFYGDSNLDGEFNSADLILVFQAGKYEDAVDDNATWVEGDWDGDRDVASSDLILAFQAGGYENGPRDPAAMVPEPSAALLMLSGILWYALRRR